MSEFANTMHVFEQAKASGKLYTVQQDAGKGAVWSHEYFSDEGMAKTYCEKLRRENFGERFWVKTERWDPDLSRWEHEDGSPAYGPEAR